MVVALASDNAATAVVLPADCQHEVWRAIPDVPDYEVSDLGRVRRASSKRIRKLVVHHTSGYLVVQLRVGCRRVATFPVHRLVMRAFVGPSTLLVNHKDRNRQNARLTNLEYVTHSENVLHAGAHRRGKTKTVRPQPAENCEWRPIPSLPMYEASSCGCIRRTVSAHTGETRTGLVLRPWFDEAGYLYVSPCCNYKKTTRSVHRLVAEAFYGRCPEGQVVDHINENKQDNRAVNLRYVTYSENTLAKERNRTSATHRGDHTRKLTELQVVEIKQRLRNGEYYCRLAKEYGVGLNTLRAIYTGETWKHVA